MCKGEEEDEGDRRTTITTTINWFISPTLE